jgi:hypothetical protein
LLSFDFERLALTTKVPNSAGLWWRPRAFGFDLKTNAEIDPALVVAPGRGHGARGCGRRPMQFFLKIDGVLGDSLDDQHKGEFDIDRYSFAINTDAAGQVTFSPLTVALDSALGSLLTQYAATGQAIDALRLVGRTAGEGRAGGLRAAAERGHDRRYG